MIEGRPALPRAGAAREALRERGQFWTPPWVADAMVAWCLGDGARTLFDPAVGAGAFFAAAKRVTRGAKRVRLSGCEIDPRALDQARANDLATADLRGVRIVDFATQGSGRTHAAIVANPPYIRHHRLSAAQKQKLRALSTRLLGRAIDGRAGLHVYFLLRALDELAPGGRLAFIVPADTVEGVFASALWTWIAAEFRIDAVVTFADGASPFPGVDTNALILCISRAEPAARLIWARCEKRGSSLTAFMASDFGRTTGVVVRKRRVDEALRTGLSREPQPQVTGPVLGDYARVRRGIATGANAFFFLTKAQARAARLPRSALIRAIGRTRDVEGSVLTNAHLNKLDRAGRPTFLFTPNGTTSRAVSDYLRRGESQGLHRRALLRTRSPWHRMETRDVPPILFAYLGRRSARFIRNKAGVVPLTGFLCVYPHDQTRRGIDNLWRLLSDPRTIANLRLVGKSYGNGAIKVEPRALERLPLPPSVVSA